MERYVHIRCCGKASKQSMTQSSSVFLAGMLLLSSIFGCALEKPSAPSWDVDVAIPLISKVYTMAEIADDEDAIGSDSTGTLFFEQSSDLDAYTVGDQLDIDDMNDTFSMQLGTFTIDAPGAEFVSVELREIYPGADALHGQTVIIPGFNFATAKKPMNAYDNFAYVVIESGNITIRVTNNLIIPLGSPITVEVWDTFADTLIVTISNPIQIDPGTTSSFSKDLAGKRLPNSLSIRMVGASPGSGGSPVLVDASSRYDMSGEISELTASEALAKVPSQTVSNEDFVTISDSVSVVEAVVDNGMILLQVTGGMPLDAWIRYELPDFIDMAGVVLVDSFFVRRNTNVSNTINLANFTLRPQMADFTQQQIRFRWRARTIDTGDQMALVRATDVMGAAFSVRDMRFASITGKLGQQDIEISQDDIEFDIPADLDSIFFETARLELVLNTTINFPTNISLTIEGQNEKGGVSYLNVNEMIEAADQPGVPSTRIIILDQQNSNINEFISILPNLVKIAGKFTLGDPDWIGTVTKDDFVDGVVKITAPFSFRLPAQTIDSDVADIEIDEDVRENIIKHLANGAFFTEVTNHLPIGATVEVVFGDLDSSLVFEQPLLRIGPFGAAAPTIDQEGYVRTPKVTEFTFDLTEEQMQTFLRTPLYSGVRVFLEGTNNQFIKVRASDFIEIKAYTIIKVNVNGD